MNLSDFVASHAVNCVEIWIDAPKASYFGAGTPMTLVNYFYKDMCYSYDTSNDAQRVVTRAFVKDARHNRFHALCFNEETLPSHRFPCVNDVSHRSTIERTSHRLNNRMYLYRDTTTEATTTEATTTEATTTAEDSVVTHSTWIRYSHSPQVDLKQMQADLDRALRSL